MSNPIMDLSRPIRTERVRWFQPPWRTVYIYRCPVCGKENRVFGPVGRGAIRCSYCAS